MKIGSILVIITLVISMAASAGARPVYDFTLNDLDGNSLRLSELKGKVILLDFWATWCKPCRAAIPFLMSLHEKYGDKGFVLIGVNADRKKGPQDIKQFVELYNIEYLNVLGNSTVMQKFGVYAMPTTILIDPGFNETMRFVGLRPEAEIELEKKITGLLKPSEENVGLCLGVIKVIGGNDEGELGDKTRRFIYKSLENSNREVVVGFTVPGQSPEKPCNYQIDGSLSVDGDKGRLTVNLYDTESGLELHSATAFGHLDNLQQLSQQVSGQLSEVIGGY